MGSRWRQGFVFLAVLPVIALSTARARAEVHSYRYALWIKSGDSQFREELPRGASLRGRVYEVETDSQGRTTRFAILDEGKKTMERRFQFSGSQKLSNGYEDFTANERTGVTRIQRDEQGRRTREDHFTVQGSLTGYKLYTYAADHVEEASYSLEGKSRARNLMYYSAKGFLIHERQYVENDDTYYDVELDETTGLAKLRKKFVNQQMSTSAAYTYDGDGRLTREDLYNSDGTWFGVLEYEQGLMTRKRYKDPIGNTKEVRISYDEKRWAKEAKLFYNNRPICTFVYDRLADGTVKRTLAWGSDGELWAEYPNLFVNEVEINGQAPNRTDGVIHKKGDWW